MDQPPCGHQVRRQLLRRALDAGNILTLLVRQLMSKGASSLHLAESRIHENRAPVRIPARVCTLEDQVVTSPNHVDVGLVAERPPWVMSHAGDPRGWV